MKLEYELTVNDILEFNKFGSWYSPDKKKYRLRNRLICALFLGIIPFVVLGDHPITRNRFLLACVQGAITSAFGFFSVRPYLLAQIERRVFKLLNEGKNQDMIEHRTMEFTGEMILVKSASSETKTNLNAIEKLGEDSNYFYIYTNTVSAYIIPKRVIKSETEIQQLRQLLTSNQSNS